MNALDLIGSVAVGRITNYFNETTPNSRVLFGIIDLANDVACAIARQMADVTIPYGRVEVYVHPDVSNGEIGRAIISDETAVHHRNYSGDDVMLTVFSVPANEANSVRQSLAHVSFINNAWLLDVPHIWAKKLLRNYDDETIRSFENVITGLRESGTAAGVMAISRFSVKVLELMEGEKGYPLEHAVRLALPEIHLPSDAGDPRLKVGDSAQNAERFFKKLHDEVRPFLYLKSKDGEPLNRAEIKARIEDLAAADEHERLPQDYADTLRAFVADLSVGDGEWLTTQSNVCNIPWEHTERIFTEAKKKQRHNFGETTTALFEREFPGRLSEEEKDLLRDLRSESGIKANSDEYEIFFSKHGSKLAKDPKLFRKWEKLVFRKPIEDDSLECGLIRLAFMTRPGDSDGEDGDEQDHMLYIRLRRGEKRSFWTEEKNTRLCRYLRDRWRGLNNLLAPHAYLDLGYCDKGWDDGTYNEVFSAAKQATEFEFEAYLVPRSAFANGTVATSHLKGASKSQLYWKPPGTAIGLGYSWDLEVLNEKDQVPLLTGTVLAKRYDRHGTSQAIALDNVTTIIDALGEDKGRFANPSRSDNDISLQWLGALERITKDGIVKEADSADLLAAFNEFNTAYTAAIKALAGPDGICSSLLTEQFRKYGLLLEKLRQAAENPASVRDLWKPILRIGLIEVRADRPTAIMTFWHPLKLCEMKVKADLLCEGVEKIVNADPALTSEIRSYVNDLTQAISKTYYGDIAVSNSTEPHLLLETRTLLDVSLLESPTSSDANILFDEPSQGTARGFERVAEEYLNLRPHEKYNFSTMLFDAESDDLPVRIADVMAKKMDREHNLRCDLLITHEDPQRLRRIYEQQNRRIGHEVDSALTSEAARNFLSRLRVGIISPTNATVRESKGHDIVILQDVIARRAKVKWTQVPRPAIQTDDIRSQAKIRSKRKPFRKGDTSSGVYLTAPNQPFAARAYVNAVHGVIEGAGSVPNHDWLPMQEVEFQSGDVKTLLEKAHKLGDWVMTYDRLADRRLVMTDTRRIVRHFSDPRSDHNIIVSTEMNEKTLGERLGSDLELVLRDPEMAAKIPEIIREIHRQSARLSGTIVMRGAQRLNHAHELLGLVLAQREIDALLRSTAETNRTAWFFIDDFQSWFDIGNQRADIIAIDFAIVSGKPVIRVVLGEAKYVAVGDLTHQRSRSMDQLESSVSVLHDRLVRKNGTVDPETWRNRIADLVLENMDPFDYIGALDFDTWLEGLRSGTTATTVSGHSLVFVHDQSGTFEDRLIIQDDDKPKSDRRLLAQWTFGRSEIAFGFTKLLDPNSAPMIAIPEEWPTNPCRHPSDHETTESAEGGADITAVSFAPETTSAETKVKPLVTHDEDESETPIQHDQQPAAMSPDSTSPLFDTPAGWLPPVYRAIMELPDLADHSANEEWLSETVSKFKRALQKEGQNGAILNSRLTPNSALVFVDGSVVETSWIEKNKIKFLTKYAIEIIRISPMPGMIAVAISRPKREILSLKSAWLRRELSVTSPEICANPVIAEGETDGELFYLPLVGEFAKQEKAAPHTMIAGTSGSGKGILATSLLLDLCAFNSPDNLHLYMFDAKGGNDYHWIKNLPHLQRDIVTQKDEAVELFRWLDQEMRRRNDVFGEYKVANIDQYWNQKSAPKDMPRIVVFFDEVANWMLDDEFKDNVNKFVDSLAQMARAAGIHLFMIYQRPDNTVVTMQLRSNLGNRLIMRLSDEGTSKIALSERGAEDLLGKGHIIARLDGGEKIYGQVPFLPENEVPKLADAIAAGWRSRWT